MFDILPEYRGTFKLLVAIAVTIILACFALPALAAGAELDFQKAFQRADAATDINSVSAHSIPFDLVISENGVERQVGSSEAMAATASASMPEVNMQVGCDGRQCMFFVDAGFDQPLVGNRVQVYVNEQLLWVASPQEEYLYSALYGVPPPRHTYSVEIRLPFTQIGTYNLRVSFPIGGGLSVEARTLVRVLPEMFLQGVCTDGTNVHVYFGMLLFGTEAPEVISVGTDKAVLGTANRAYLDHGRYAQYYWTMSMLDYLAIQIAMLQNGMNSALGGGSPEPYAIFWAQSPAWWLSQRITPQSFNVNDCGKGKG